MKTVRSGFFGIAAAGNRQKMLKIAGFRKTGVWRIRRKPDIDVNFRESEGELQGGRIQEEEGAQEGEEMEKRKTRHTGRGKGEKVQK